MRYFESITVPAPHVLLQMRLVLHDPDHTFVGHEKDIPMPERKPLTEEEKKNALEM